MKPGVKPLPDNLKALYGEPNANRYNPNAPKPSKGRPSCPAHLSTSARTEWNRIAKELYILDLLTQVDRAALAAYCECYGEWVDVCRLLKKQGFTIMTDKGNIVQNPLVGIKHRSAELMHKFLIEFGMTPSSRTRLIVDDPNNPDDAMSRILSHPVRKN